MNLLKALILRKARSHKYIRKEGKRYIYKENKSRTKSTESEKIKRGFIAGAHGYRNRYYEIYINPTERDLKEINKNAHEEEEKNSYRAYITKNGDVYVWNSGLLHEEGLKVLDKDVLHTNGKTVEEYNDYEAGIVDNESEFKNGVIAGCYNGLPNFHVHVIQGTLQDSAKEFIKKARIKNPSFKFSFPGESKLSKALNTRKVNYKIYYKGVNKC
jgi:hypothetical protein